MTRASVARAARAAASAMAVIYIRVSTEEQDDSGAGLAAQEHECRSYAERNGLTVVAVVREEPVSGKVLPAKRPGFSRALTMLDSADAGTLLVRRLDRVSRKVRHALATVDDADAAGWSIVTTDGRVNTATAAGRLQINVMASVAQYETDVISERTREALAARKAAGVRLGAVPVIPEPVVARIRTEHLGGASMRAIAAGLTADGVPTAKGGPWSHATVQRVLQRA